MVHEDNVSDRVRQLEVHVLSQTKDNPGLLMRVDRLELFLRLLIGLAGLGVLWTFTDIVRIFLTRQIAP